MACQYEINGVWYSEEEIKSIFEQSEKKSKEYYALVDRLESATPEEKQDIEAKIAELEKEFSVEITTIPETTGTKPTESLEVKPEVKEIFESNPELQSIGTVEQYSKYLDTIFPDSKVKDVVYHGTSFYGFDKFSRINLGASDRAGIAGFDFTKDRSLAERYKKGQFKNGDSSGIYSVILNVLNDNPRKIIDIENINNTLDILLNENLIDKKIYNNVQQYISLMNINTFASVLDTLFMYSKLNKSISDVEKIIYRFMDITNIDMSYYGKSLFENIKDKISVYKPEQIHILGNEQDIQGFKEFVSSENSALKENIESEEYNRPFEKGTPKQLPTLKLERSEQEVVKPSQVLLPWKFAGKLSKYIKDGKLDMSKIDPKILTGFGMRIPNQGPNSQTYFEIVGFLPKESGDLAIVSKDLVTQMGHDFDFDTFWAYLYETIEYDGILQPITQELTDRILSDLNITKEQIPELRRTLEFYKEELAELKEITYNTAKTTKEYEIAKGSKLKETSDKLFEELESYSNLHKEVVRDINILISLNDILNGDNSIIKNKILDTHIAVHSNPNKTVQKQIKTPISGWILHDFAKKMDKISEKEFQLEYNRIVAENKAITANNTKNNTNNKLKDLPLRQARLSDAYQTDKFISGRSGKDGVGIFSLAGVFFSVLTQSNQNNKTSDDNRIAYKILTEKGLKNWFLQVGNNHLDGTLDSLYSTNKILKTSIIEGVQSVSVDNANDVVMDKINLNTHTFKFVVGSVATGLDSQIPLIMNQPIIREYAKRIESGNKVGSSSFNIAKSVYEELVKEYQTKGKITVDTKVVNSKTIEDTQSQKRKYLHAGKFLTDAVLDDMLVGPNTQADYYFLQLSVLNVFKELENVGASLQDVMSTTNTDSSLLDKSLIETSAKETRLDNVLSNSTIINIDKVLGNVLAGIKSLEPSTINGYATKYGLSFNNTLWDKLMPYNDVAVNEVFNRAAQKFGYDPKNVSKISNLKRKVWSGIRSYLLTDPRLGLTDKPIAEERKRLFFDVPNSNMSLASYISILKSKTSTLQFINILNPEIDITGKEPSILSVSSAQLEESDMNSIYRGFLDLVIRDRKLPDFNGEPMTTRRLAGELVLAATISGGVKDFKSYSHLIPPVYLYNITEKDSAVTYIEKLTSLIANPKLGDIFSVVGINDLIFQIAQHNPDLVANVDVKTFTAVGNAGEYRYKGTEVLDYEYLTTGRGRNTVLYKKKPNGLYVKVVTKTKLGYKAYEFRTLKGVNIEDHTHPVGKSLQIDNVNTTIEKNVVEHLMIQDGSEPDIQNTLSIIEQSSPATYNRKLASVFKSLITDTDIKLSTGKLVTSSVDPITDEEVNTPIKGKYNPNTKTVHINTDKSAYKNGIDVYDLETTVLHELTHHITYSKFREAKRLINDGKASSKIAMAVARLEGLFDKYKLEASKLKASGVIMNENSTKNIDEFFSELITNPDVQKIADTIAYSADKSILDRFIDSVLSLLEALGINLDSTTAFALADIITIYRDTDSSNIELESNSTIAPFRDFMEYFPTKMDVSKEYGTIKNNDYVTFTNTTSKLKAKEINDSQGVYIAVPKEIALDSYIITLQKDTRMLDINYAYEQLDSTGKKKITDKIC